MLRDNYHPKRWHEIINVTFFTMQSKMNDAVEKNLRIRAK